MLVEGPAATLHDAVAEVVRVLGGWGGRDVADLGSRVVGAPIEHAPGQPTLNGQPWTGTLHAWPGILGEHPKAILDIIERAVNAAVAASSVDPIG